MQLFDDYLKEKIAKANEEKYSIPVGGGGGAGAFVEEPEPYKPIDFNEYLKAPSTEEMNQKQDALLTFEKDYEAVTLAIDTNYELYKEYTKQLDDLEEELQTAPPDMEFNLNQKYNKLRDEHNILVEKLQGDTKTQKEIYQEYTKIRTTYDEDIEIYNRWAKAQNEKEPEPEEVSFKQKKHLEGREVSFLKTTRDPHLRSSSILDNPSAVGGVLGISQPLDLDKINKYVAAPLKGVTHGIYSTPQAVGGLMRLWGENMEKLEGTPNIFMGDDKKYKDLIDQRTQKPETRLDKFLIDKSQEIITINREYLKDEELYPDPDDPLAAWLFQLGSGVTSLAGAVGISLLTHSPHAAAIAFGLYQTGGIYQEAREADVETGKATGLAVTAGVIEGALEYIGLQWLFTKFGGNFWVDRLLHAGLEGFQEFSQQLGENVVAILGWDKTRSILRGTAESTSIGAVLGGGASAITGSIDDADLGGLTPKQKEGLIESIVGKQLMEVREMLSNLNPKKIAQTLQDPDIQDAILGVMKREALAYEAKEIPEAKPKRPVNIELLKKELERRAEKIEQPYFDELLKVKNQLLEMHTIIEEGRSFISGLKKQPRDIEFTKKELPKVEKKKLDIENQLKMIEEENKKYSKEQISKAKKELKVEPKAPELPTLKPSINRGNLIANDISVLEECTPGEILEKGDKAFEKYWDKITPKWAYNEGVNTTTEIDVAEGFGAYVIGLEIGKTEIFEPNDIYVQIRKPEKCKVVGIYDTDKQEVLFGDKTIEEIQGESEVFRGTTNKAEIIDFIKSKKQLIREKVTPKAPAEPKAKEKTEPKKVEEKVEPKVIAIENLEFESPSVKKGVEGSKGRVEAMKEILKTKAPIPVEKLRKGWSHYYSTPEAVKNITAPLEGEWLEGGKKVKITEGNHRLLAYQQLGIKEVPVIIKGETKEEISVKKSLEEQLKESQKEINRLKGIIKTIKGNKEKRQEFKKELVKYIKENMPYAIRNKMIATVKNVSGDKALEKAMEKIDEYTLEHYSRQYTKAITNELKAKKIKPKRQKSGMLKGRFTPAIQDKLDFIRTNINGSRTKAIEKIQENITLFNQGKAINIQEENELLNMVGIKEMDLETLQFTLTNIKSLKKEGKTLKGIKDAENKKRHEGEIIDTLESTTGKQVEIDEETGKGIIDSSYRTLPKTKEMSWIKKTIDKIVNWQFGLDNLADKLSVLDKTSKPYESKLSKIVDKVHYARVANIGSFEDVLSLIQVKFAEAFEVTSRKEITRTCQKLREQVDLGEFENSRGDKVHFVLTKEQILKKVMQLDDPTLEKTFDDGMLFTEEIKDAFRDSVTKKEQAYIDGVREVYDYMWKRINPIFEEMYGIHFPRNPFYSGTIRRDTDMNTPEASLLAQDAFNFASVLNPSLKARSKSKQSLQYDDMTASLMNYVMQMEHFINFAKPLNDLRSVFGDKRVKAVIHELFGMDVLKKINGFLDDITRDGVDKAKIIKSVDTIRFNFTRSILAKPHIALKQIPSVLAYMTEMPVVDFFEGVGNFWKNPIKNYRYLVENSPYARARFGEGFERDIHGAMKSDYAHLLSHTHKFSDMFMGMVRAGDKFAVMQGMWAKFYSETKGQTTKAKNAEQAIRRAEIVTQRTQPSFTIESLATGQRGGSFLKLFTMFQNQPNKYFRIIADNARNFKYGRGSRMKAASNIVLAWAILPMIFQFIGDGGKWIEKHQLRALILGAVNDLLVFGSMIRGMYGWLIKEAYDVNASPVFATMREMEYCLAKVAKWSDPTRDIEPEDIQAFTEHFAKGLGQLVGLPTPYGVQVKKAIESGDYRQLLFSEYILNLGEEKKKKKKPYVKSYGKEKYSKYLKGGYTKKGKYSKFLKY